MNFGDRLLAAMNEMGWGPKDLERLSGVADSTISAITRRGSDLSKYKEKLIGHFPVTRISHTWLRTEIGTMIPSAITFETGIAPTLATQVRVVCAARMSKDGTFEADAADPGHVTTYSEDGAAYAMRVKGDLLAPVIRDGWLLVVEPGTPPIPGEFVLLRMLDGTRMLMELLYARADSIAVMSISGGERTTIDRSTLDAQAGMHAVVAILPPSKWVPER